MTKVTLEMVLKKVIELEPQNSRVRIVAQNGILDRLDAGKRMAIREEEPTPTLVFGLLMSAMMAAMVGSHRKGDEEMFGDKVTADFINDFVELHEKITKVCVSYAIEGILKKADEVPQYMKEANDIIERIKNNIH